MSRQKPGLMHQCDCITSFWLGVESTWIVEFYGAREQAVKTLQRQLKETVWSEKHIQWWKWVVEDVAEMRALEFSIAFMHCLSSHFSANGAKWTLLQCLGKKIASAGDVHLEQVCSSEAKTVETEWKQEPLVAKTGMNELFRSTIHC